MNFPLMIRRGRLVLSLVGLVCVVIVAAVVWRTAAIQRNQAAEGKGQFHASLRDGVGSEVSFAKQNDGEDNCRASANSLSNFMFKRSGVKLSGQTKTRLARMESRTLAGIARRISPDELAEILANTAVERTSSTTDSEIDHAAETLRGFDAPDLPDSFRRGRNKIQLRASIAGTVTPEDLKAQLKSVRDGDSALKGIFQGAAKIALSSEVGRRVNSLSEAIPETFGAVNNGLTPIQAVLITYSVAGDDLLMDSEVNLQKRLYAIQTGLTRITGQTYASPNGHTAYGVNGYVFSTPLDLVFDDQTVNILLGHLEERSEGQ